MSAARMHYELARTGKATQKCDLPDSVPGTNYGGTERSAPSRPEPPSQPSSPEPPKTRW